MKSKRKILSGTMVVTFLFTMMMAMTVCMASVPDSEISIGGVSYGSSIDDVRNSYGAPDKVDTTNRHPLWRGFVDTYYYGSSFKVIFSDGNTLFISSTANNGLGTPAGVLVGMNRNTLRDVYGSPDGHASNYYFYQSESNSYVGLKFMLNSQGKITAIYAGSFD